MRETYLARIPPLPQVPKSFEDVSGYFQFSSSGELTVLRTERCESVAIYHPGKPSTYRSYLCRSDKQVDRYHGEEKSW